MRRGMTLVETIIAMLLAITVFGLVWNLWVSGRKSEEQLTTGFSAQQDLQIAVQRLTRELQEGVSLFYPRPEDDVQAGVGFINSAGRSVFYYLEQGQAGEGGTLYRVDLGTKQRLTLCSKVNYFKVKVQEPAPGKKVSLASLNLSVLRGDTDTEGKADDYALVTKVFLRNLRKPLPE